MPSQGNTKQATPIAIVGMSCRLSGDVSNLDDFWTLVSRSRDGWSPVPKSRFSADAYYHPNPQKKGCFNQKGGYFMDRDFSKFDAPFFQITAQEAMAMDPQQRQLLECTYEALENAGFPKEYVSGKNMGVFIGGTSSDYRQGLLKDLTEVPTFDATGNHQSIQAGRISYYFDLRGPCFAVDTACSSSLYALHSAVQCIRSGEADSAVVAGCSLHMQPDDTISMSNLGIFNDHGKTYAFDERAKSGFARGEGVGCLVLKPLDQAIKDNDKIRSVIANTGINHDGKTIGIATPNGEAQEQLMRDVYSRAGIDPEEVGFVEAHGTGTKVGDPIEAGAIYRVFGSGRTKRFPLYMGSVKTNFGHLENASGIISVIKASLMLEKGFILPNVNFQTPNPAIPLSEWNIKVPTSIRPWPKNKKYISINNFGFGGSNAHAVLEKFPTSLADMPQSNKNEFPKLFVLSANDEEAAKRVGSNLGIYIEQHPEVFQKRLVSDLSYTLGERRTHFPWRVALVASSCDELALSLNGSAAIPVRASTAPKVGFVYTGQGAQWAQMGKELMDSHPIFHTAVKAASDYLLSIGSEFNLLEELVKGGKESIISEAHISQPICSAVQIGLTDLLASWGVKPEMVVGHSSGEIGAAYATGAITMEDAMAAAYYRGQVASKLRVKHTELKGSMLAVGAGSAEVKSIIEKLGLRDVGIACENSPSSITASGDEGDVDKLAAELESQGTFNRKLRVDVAYHSSHMQRVADEYLETIRTIEPKTVEGVKFYSSLFGAKLESTAALGASYWVENLTKPVLFASSLKEMYNDAKPDLLVEIGPHAALKGPIKQILKDISPKAAQEVSYYSALVRNQDATGTMVRLAGDLFLKGQPLDIAAVNQTSTAGRDKPALITDFTPYPFSEHKYWYESRSSQQHRMKPFGRHDLLGLLDDAYSEANPTWRNTINTDDIPWLKDHRMQSLATFPLAGYMCMAVEAASQRAQLRGIKPEQISGFRLREVQASKALILDDGAQYETLVSFNAYAEGTRSYSNDWDEFRISSWTSSRGWLEHCRGLIGVKQQRGANPVTNGNLQGALARREKIVDVPGGDISLEKFYSELEGRGAGYGSVFQLQPDSGLKVQGEYSTSRVVVPDTASTMHSHHEPISILPAAFTDLCFQLMFPILGAGNDKMPSLFMPSAIKEMEINSFYPNQAGAHVQVVAHARPDFNSPGPVDFFIDAWREGEAEPAAKFAGVRMTPVGSDLGETQAPRSLCYKVEWEPLAGKPKDEEEPLVNGEKKDGAVEQTDAVNGVATSEVSDTETEEEINVLQDAEIVIITDRARSDSLVSSLSSLMERLSGSKPSIASFSDAELSTSARYICLSELDAPLLHGMSSETFGRLQQLLLTCGSMLWVTSGAYRFAETPQNNLIQGFLRTIRSENSKVAATLDLDPASALLGADHADLITQALIASLATPADGSPVDFEFSEENGGLVVPRVVSEEDMNLNLFRETQSSAPYLQDFVQEGRRFSIAVGTYGAIDSLYWKDEPELPLSPNDIEIKVAATGMNFKDVVIAMGQVASPYLGVECSGTVARIGSNVTSLQVGDRVCAMSLGAYSTYARCPATSAAVIPDDMSFDVAASIPVVYSTAYYGLLDLGRLEAGEKILIHAASGGVGQAAIQLANMIGAEVYATVGSVEKKQHIIDTYGVPESHIFYSRDTDFGPALREATNGQGVDVVINSLAGDLLRETWDCLAPFGRFIEIGKRDITSNTRLEMAKFAYNCTFSSVDLTLVADERPKIMGRVLKAVMNLLGNKTINPIGPITTVPISEVEPALRKLQSGKTSGKVVVSHVGDSQVKATHPAPSADKLKGDVTYVIIGGTGGLGRSMAKRMVQRGARHIVLLSRSGKVTSELSQLIEECRVAGAAIHVKSCDVADASSVNTLVNEVQQLLPPVRGVIHAAMVLMDVLFEKMTYDQYENVVRSKVDGAWNMHKALHNVPLDFFIVLSSVAGIVGNRGQTAYAAANTFLDAFVHHRRRHGLVASSLDLTAVEGVGYLAEKSARQTEVLKNLSGNTMGEAEVLALVEAAMDGKVAGICNDQCITGLSIEDPSNLPYYASDGKFSYLRDAALANSAEAAGADGNANVAIAVKLQQTKTVEDAQEVVTLGLSEKLGAILMLPPEVMAAEQAKTSITALGLDSLNAIELRNWIGKELQAHLQVLELLTSGSMRDLAGLILRKSRLKGVWTPSE